MNAQLITAISLVLASTAFVVRAESPTPDPYQHTMGARPRADVVVERDMASAGKSIDVMHGEDSGSFHLAANRLPSLLTRAQVRAEVLEARAQGLLDAMYGEDSGSVYLARIEHAKGSPVLQARTAR